MSTKPRPGSHSFNFSSSLSLLTLPIDHHKQRKRRTLVMHHQLLNTPHMKSTRTSWLSNKEKLLKMKNPLLREKG